MNFELSDEQAMIGEALSGFLARHYAFDARLAIVRSEPGFSEDVWRGLVRDLGLFEIDGADDAVARMIVMEQLGRALTVEPVAETLFQGAPLLSRAGPAGRALLERIPSSEVRLAVAVLEQEAGDDFSSTGCRAVPQDGGWRVSGKKAMVVGAPWATHILLAARSAGEVGDSHGLSLFVVPVDRAGCRMRACKMLDERRAADLDFDGMEILRDEVVGDEGWGLALLEEWRDRAIAAMASEAVGVLERLLSDTVVYCKQREQFGQPIGSFQALQHRMVDMYLHLEMLKSAALLANLKLESSPDERARAVSAAKVTLAEACRFIGQNAVQLHGGMGMTDELPIGHYFKRATALEHAFGRADWHRARHARLAAA